ncbi:MAG: hypothetical protein JXR51_01810 [Bacteroidales bacterium]|nr:hypothetical protein [Bacteroidales bacterium]MBN2755881.1 hypothetical protein [Bacteroidales bacterium]
MNKIICPKCQAVLNPDNNIVLSAKKDDNKWGLVLLSSELGNYTALTHEDFVVKEGEFVEFHCPACHYKLSTVAPDKNLAVFEMIDEEQVNSTIIISAIAGEKCTYKITEGSIESHGKDSEKYKFIYQNLVDLV